MPYHCGDDPRQDGIKHLKFSVVQKSAIVCISYEHYHKFRTWSKTSEFIHFNGQPLNYIFNIETTVGTANNSLSEVDDNKFKIQILKKFDRITVVEQ